MKRKSMDESKGSELRLAIEELSVMVKLKGVILDVKGENGDRDDAKLIRHEEATAYIPTRPFLSLCYFLLQVLDKIGPTMAVLRQDIHHNIRRLEMMHESDPTTYSNVVEILKTEATDGTARNLTSCSRALVWLTRALDFTAALLQCLTVNPSQNMKAVAEESYNLTLKPWHRWISSAASKIALMLVPDNMTFIKSLKTKDDSYDNLKVEMDTLASLLAPFLEHIHSILNSYHLDKLKAN